MEKEYEKVKEYLIQQIREGTLEIGSKLPAERVLSSELGIGRNSVREALKCLENMGMIESRQGSGNFVVCQNVKVIENMLEIMLNMGTFSRKELNAFRKSMDKMVCSLLIEQNSNLDEIADKADEMLDKKPTNAEEEIEIDRKFHFYLIEATNNRLLISLMQAMSELYRSAIDYVLAVCDEEKKQGFFNAHKKVVEALRMGSKAKCDECVEHHYRLVEAVVEQADNTFNAYKGTEHNKNQNYQSDVVTSDNYHDRDYLTGLYKQDVFFEKVDEYIKGHPDEELMMWAFDIQGLRFINEKYGIEVGDKVLQVVAGKGKNIKNYVFGGRMDGGSFCSLMKGNQSECKNIFDILRNNFNEQLPVRQVFVKNGVYHVKKSDALSAKAMYVRAVLALQTIKESTDYMVKEYDDKMREELLVSRQIVDDAQMALLRGEFKVYFQPKIDVKKRKMCGAEALVRWFHPELGYMHPGLFIELFEQNGFIKKLDLYIWEQVCENIVEWRNKGFPKIPISINVSKKSFEDEEIAEKIIKLVNEYKIDHSLIEIEITEYSCLGKTDLVRKTINKLHNAGFTIALDDFGTGYSSMIVLSTMDLDILKLDMSLIKNDTPGSKKNALEFSLQLANMMQLKTVAEGIETAEQVERVCDLGADFIQGYFYSKPIPKDEFEEYMRKEFDMK